MFRRSAGEAAKNVGRAIRNRDGYRKLARRDYTFRALSRVTPYVGVDAGDIRYIVSTADRAVGRETFMRRGYDSDVMERLLGIVAAHMGRPPVAGRTFLDIGANIGTTTIPAVVRYGATRVIAFEPAPDAYALLRCNVVLNGLDEQVDTLQVAVSDQPGLVTLELSDQNWGDRRVRVRDSAPESDQLGEANWQTAAVRAARFDDLVAELEIDVETIGLAWIDTQGHEASVLAGASELLGRQLPMIVEYWPYGLARAGGTARLHELLSVYPRFVDGRAAITAPRPIDELPGLHERYPGVDDYTDLVLLPS